MNIYSCYLRIKNLYPEIKDVKLWFLDDIRVGLAFYDDERRNINLPRKAIDEDLDVFWLIVMLHEVRHALQHIEGFPGFELYHESDEVYERMERDADSWALLHLKKHFSDLEFDEDEVWDYISFRENHFSWKEAA